MEGFKYNQVRELVFNYYVKEKELFALDYEIKRFDRIVPHDNAYASMYVMEKMEKVMQKRDCLKLEIDKMKEEIESVLKIILK